MCVLLWCLYIHAYTHTHTYTLYKFLHAYIRMYLQIYLYVKGFVMFTWVFYRTELTLMFYWRQMCHCGMFTVRNTCQMWDLGMSWAFFPCQFAVVYFFTFHVASLCIFSFILLVLLSLMICWYFLFYCTKIFGLCNDWTKMSK